MDKDSLRRQLMKRRGALTISELELKSRAISKKLITNIDWSKIKSVHTYRPVTEWKEVDTEPLIQAVRKRWPKISVEVALVEKSQPLPAKKFDLIIVPVLGFDNDNHRLGLGGGWYDRFLVTQPQAKKIGLAYQLSFIPDGLQHEPHDIKLDTVITEEAVWQ